MSFFNSFWYNCVEDAASLYIVGYITSTAGYSDLSGLSSKLKWVLKFTGFRSHRLPTGNSQASAPIKTPV